MFPDSPTPSTTRSLRADAQRNRDALVEAARRALGADTRLTLEGVAREAGVGIGTLYRHFPTKHALVEAVYGAELDDLTASAATLLAELEPVAALREWIGRYARFAATKRGMLDSLQAGLAPTALPMPGSRERLAAAVEALLTAGVENGTLRDVDPDDVVMLLLGVFLATSSAADTEQPARLLDLVLDALKVQPDDADPLPRA